MAHFKLKDGMLLGVATAATQIEGGDRANSWYDWAETGHIKDGSSPVRADGHWERVREDTELMADMGLQIYRFSVEWSRIEPQKGEFSEEALEHYRRELQGLRENGIRPLMTLHHFTNPRWFERMGAFEHPQAPELFLRFVEKTVRALGDLCGEYVTINEPNVYAFSGLLAGEWPPGKQDFGAVTRAYRTFTQCHIRAYKLIHRLRREMGFEETKVGVANSLRVFSPLERDNPYHRFLANAGDVLFQGSLTRAMMTGECRFPVPEAGEPLGRYYDFIGINYYSRTTMHRAANDTRPGTPRNDLDWEVYPRGIALLAKAMYEKYKAPIWITENGAADSRDAFRARYIYEHLKALCELDVPVERYYHWCFIDNFEWLEGESARFGLVHIDYETQERTVKQSGYFFSEIIENGGVTEDMYRRYVAGQRYEIK